jgi:exoribonuclease-2
MLLYAPDKQAIETKALMAACDALHANPLALLDACGAIPSTHDYHFNRFLFEAFPRGIDFPPLPEPLSASELVRAPVRAFSIDDAATTEIDDAFSVRPLASGNLEIGIHIACPALAIARGTALDALARARLSGLHAGRRSPCCPMR